MLQKIKIKTPQFSYSVFISKNNLAFCAKQLKNLLQETTLFVITNTKVAPLYQKKIKKIFEKYFKTKWLVLPDGEQHKNLKNFEKALSWLVQNRATRESLLLGLGGGVICDLTGFVASTFKRGLTHTLMPTTLLAQVDAAIGGKTALNFKSAKNGIGTFAQPGAVFTIIDFLKTLPRKEFACGMAEAIKYGMIADPSFLNWIDKNHRKIWQQRPQTLLKLVATGSQIKAEFVRQDERDQNKRLALNFGHTLGHAIESLNSYKKYSHGEAVAMGMMFATKLSYELGFAKEDHSTKLASLLTKNHLPTRWPKAATKTYRKGLIQDKKAQEKYLRFILLEKIGKILIKQLREKDVLLWLSIKSKS